MIRRIAELPLSAKGVLVVAIPVCALLMVMLVFLRFDQRSLKAGEWVEHTYQVRAEIRQVAVDMIDAEAATRGYVLTGREQVLDGYRAARKDVPAHLAVLRRLVPDNASQIERVNQLEGQVLRAFQSLDGIQREAAGGRTANAAAMDAANGEMERLRAHVAEMVTEETRLLELRRSGERDAQHRLEAGVLISGALGLLGGIMAALVFTRRIGGRLGLLEEAARHVAQGLPVRADMQGNDEIARFSRTLKETADLIANQTAELRAAHEGLESRVVQRTAELQAANEQLHHANEVRHAILRSCPLAIWAIDLDGNITFWSPAAERIFGWTEAEVIHGPLPVVPDAGRAEFQQWLELFRQGVPLTAMERRRLKKDGSLLDVVIWTAPLRDAAGGISGTIAIDSDVTERKLIEAQFRQSQKLEAVGRLAGGVAHDFNNLLTVIMGYVEMLIADAQGRGDLIDYAQEIQYAASRASSLTAQLLAFGRRQISQPKVLDLNEVVEHSMKLLRRVIGEDIEISVHLDPALGKVNVDPIHIDQVMMNLVVNARDAMTGGGRLTIDTAQVTLDEHYSDRHLGVAPGSYAMLAISDTGMGMDAETRNRVFEPFFTTKEAGKGTGLGLSIVYGIVKQAGGEIMVYSEEGKGTTFKIYLPLAEASGEAPTAEPSLSGLRGSETILLCEDESKIRKLVEMLLLRQGYTVLEADTPAAALEIARSHAGPIDLLLTDVVMPLKNGFEVAQEIQALRPGVRLLFMSGYTDNRVSGEWSLNREIPFLQKPFTVTGLTQKVREVLGAPAATV